MLQNITYSFLSNNVMVGGDGSFHVMLMMMMMMIMGGEAKFMHHPISFSTFASTTTIINQRFLQANAVATFTAGRVNGPIDTGGFPETRTCYSIRPYAIPVFSSSFAEKVPFLLSHIACF